MQVCNNKGVTEAEISPPIHFFSGLLEACVVILRGGAASFGGRGGKEESQQHEA